MKINVQLFLKLNEGKELRFSLKAAQQPAVASPRRNPCGTFSFTGRACEVRVRLPLKTFIWHDQLVIFCWLFVCVWKYVWRSLCLSFLDVYIFVYINGEYKLLLFLFVFN